MSGYYACLFHGEQETRDQLDEQSVKYIVVDTDTDHGDFAMLCSIEGEDELISLGIDYEMVSI